MATNINIKINLAKNTKRENKTEQQLKILLEKYNLDKWIFTDTVRIEEMVRPRSHPVLRLNTYHIGNDDILLSVFLHEQIHWFVENNPVEKEKALAELKITFPKVPIIKNDVASTYNHLIINYLEYNALRKYVGESRAKEAISIKDIYTDLYKMVFQNETNIYEILKKHNLII